MDVRIDEVAEQTYRLSAFVPQAADGAGFTFNHFLIVGDEPLLFHCGLRKMFPLVSAAVGKIMPVDCLRWLSFGHFEADERVDERMVCGGARRSSRAWHNGLQGFHS